MTQHTSSTPPEQILQQIKSDTEQAVNLDTKEKSALYQEIQQLIGLAEADNIQQCRTVAFGAKPCGGPDSYLVYSVKGLDEPSFLNKVQRFNELQRLENIQSGVMSTCDMVMEPQVKFEAGRCVVNKDERNNGALQ